ncbi:hypothetical protein GCM10010199_58470 [Dactylosporangium roseum]
MRLEAAVYAVFGAHVPPCGGLRSRSVRRSGRRPRLGVPRALGDAGTARAILAEVVLTLAGGLAAVDALRTSWTGPRG